MQIFLLICAVVIASPEILSAQDITPAKGPLIQAHRGGSLEQEENTLRAFQACYELGIRGFETDIRMTKDGVLVILHDDTLNRTHNAMGSVEHKTAAELKSVMTKKGQKLLFLDELLDYFADKPGVYLELEMKTSNQKLYPDDRIQSYCQKLYTASQMKCPKGSIYLFTSFDERALKAIRDIDPKAPKSLISGKPLSPELIQLAQTLGATHLACQMTGSSRKLVQQAQKQGFQVIGWPGRSVQDFYLAVGLGVDVISTDIPAVMQRLMKKSPGIRNGNTVHP
ncbi:MAG: glycerophosphodiester phosphodiesterase [Bacteroidales bacterium]|nr:glycerophosphodiester phosphodiesterase [Bacteroidales bacterium]